MHPVTLDPLADSRAELLEIGKRLGFPIVWFDADHAVAHSSDGWERFTEHASADRLALALVAARKQAKRR